MPDPSRPLASEEVTFTKDVIFHMKDDLWRTEIGDSETDTFEVVSNCVSLKQALTELEAWIREEVGY